MGRHNVLCAGCSKVMRDVNDSDGKVFRIDAIELSHEGQVERVSAGVYLHANNGVPDPKCLERYERIVVKNNTTTYPPKILNIYRKG